MPDDVMTSSVAQIFSVYGPAALPIIGLLLIIKYLLDKDKQREIKHDMEMKEEEAKIEVERNKNDVLRTDLLTEARGNATLAEELKKTLQLMASRSP
jgi:hypothetical protein